MCLVFSSCKWNHCGSSDVIGLRFFFLKGCVVLGLKKGEEHSHDPTGKGKLIESRWCIALDLVLESSNFTLQNHNIKLSRKALLWIFLNPYLRYVPGAGAMPVSMWWMKSLQNSVIWKLQLLLFWIICILHLVTCSNRDHVFLLIPIRVCVSVCMSVFTDKVHPNAH